MTRATYYSDDWATAILVQYTDKFGISVLLEAVKGGHDNCLSILTDKGAELHLQGAGAYLRQAVKSGNNELLQRLLIAGVDVSASDCDRRTALNLAAAEGSFGLAKILLDAGADSFAAGRYGTALGNNEYRQMAFQSRKE